MDLRNNLWKEKLQCNIFVKMKFDFSMNVRCCNTLVETKPRRGEKFSGGECLGRGIFPRQFGRGGFGGENLKNFPAGGVWRGF